MRLVKLKEILEDCVCGPSEKIECGEGRFFTVTTEWYDCLFAEYYTLRVVRGFRQSVIQLSCDRGVLYHRMYKPK